VVCGLGLSVSMQWRTGVQRIQAWAFPRYLISEVFDMVDGW